MLRSLALCFLLVPGFTCYAQSVTVRPSAIVDIELIGPQAPEFAASVSRIVGSEQLGGLVDWLPYGVVVKNNSSQTLAGMALMFSLASDGKALGGSLLTPTWFTTAGRIKPGQSVIAIPQSVLAQPRDLTPFLRGGKRGNLSNYQQAHSLEISLTGVVFASGQFAGSDEHQEYERWRATIDAPRSVAKAVLERKASGPLSDTVAWLQTVADVSSMADADFRAIQGSGMARGMLRTYQENGEAAMYSLAEETLRQPVFPLHR